MNEVPLPPNAPVPPQSPTPHKDFIETLRALNEPMKMRVLVAASAVMMVVVVYVWVGYFNNIVLGNPAQLADQSAVAQPVVPIAVPVAQPAASAPGFWAQLGSGFAAMYHGAVSGFKGAGSALQSPKQYDITPAGTAPAAAQ